MQDQSHLLICMHTQVCYLSCLSIRIETVPNHHEDTADTHNIMCEAIQLDLSQVNKKVYVKPENTKTNVL